MITRSTETPMSPVSSLSSEAVSLTGISSGSETITLPVILWSVTMASSSSACVCIGPTRAMFAKVRGV